MKNTVSVSYVRFQALNAFFIFLGILVWPYKSSADTHYVALTGGNVAPYTNAATAATSIQPAVNAAVSGDTVLIAVGTFLLSATISVPDGITVKGAGAGKTIVDGNNAVQCFSLAATAVVSEMTITKGYVENSGGGISGGIAVNCTLFNNSAFCSRNYGNAYHGCAGGAWGSTLYYCTLTSNSASVTSGYLSGYNTSGGAACSSTLYSCLIVGNSANTQYDSSGGAVYGGTLYNCTITGNLGTGCAGGPVGSTLYNSIIYPDSMTATTVYNCCTINPQFVGGGDYSLSSRSSCISAANALYATDRDILGFQRGPGPDIGAYEYASNEDRDLILQDYQFSNSFDVVIQSVTPRNGSNLIDIDYLYTNSVQRAAEIRGFAYSADIKASQLNYASKTGTFLTFIEGTATNYGVGIRPSMTPRRLTWDAGVDIGCSVQNIKIILLACETNALPFSQHFVTIPASGTNGALSISRYAGIADEYALNRALLFSIFRGWATNSGPTLYAVGGTYNGQTIFTNSGLPTASGKLWLCEKMGTGIRLATAAEIKRAQEATTPGAVAQRPSYTWAGMKVNAYGIETGVSNAWYFVKQ